MYKHILVPMDGSPLSDQAVDYAATLAKAVGARVTLIMVTSPFPALLYSPGFVALPDSYVEELDAAAAAALAREKQVVAAKGVPCEAIQVEHEQVYQAIIDAARNKGCDLIVMASHGRRGVAAVVLGSQTTKVLTHSKIPVLVCR